MNNSTYDELVKEIRKDWQHLNIRMHESVQDVMGYLAYNSAFNPYEGFLQNQVNLPPFVRPYYNQNNRNKGEQLPVYTTSAELKIIRDQSRLICFFNEYAIGGVGNRVNYTLGDNGLKHTAVPVNPRFRKHDYLAEEVNEYLNILSEINDLPELEQNTATKFDFDGEAGIRLFDDGGYPVFRPIQPEHVYSPTGDSDAANSFGIRTPEEDIMRPEGYWISPNGIISPKLVSTDEVVWIKGNTLFEAKRGLPTFHPVKENLIRVDKLQNSMTTMAIVRAKIAVVQKLANTNQDAATALLNKLNATRITDPATGNNVTVEQLLPGTILRTNSDIEFPPASVGASDFVEVLHAELRAVGQRLNMPEWMFIGVLDSKYNNAMVAESYVVKSFKRLQTMWKRNFGQNRYSYRASLLWKAIRMAVRAGVLPVETLSQIKIVSTGPPLETRNKAEDAQVDKIYNEMGVKTIRKIQEEQGIDIDEEVPQLETLPLETVKQLMSIVSTYTSGTINKEAARVLIKHTADLPDLEIMRLLSAEPITQSQGTDTSGLMESRLTEAFTEQDHPRDDHGRFISTGDIEAAKTDPKKAAQLRAKTTDPEQLSKLNRALGQKSEEHLDKVNLAKRGKFKAVSTDRLMEMIDQASRPDLMTSKQLNQFVADMHNMRAKELNHLRQVTETKVGKKKADLAQNLVDHLRHFGENPPDLQKDEKVKAVQNDPDILSLAIIHCIQSGLTNTAKLLQDDLDKILKKAAKGEQPSTSDTKDSQK